jgi:D-alanyl-D-alanine carboxypeptidase/D-alanyl-D-alanine-endopeptidase (penicillin-binding protein 4)
MSAIPRRGRPQPISIAALTAIAAVPAIALAGTWGYADVNIAAETTTTTTLAPGPPVVQLPTPVLSYRRHPTPLAERAAAEQAAATERDDAAHLLELVGPGSCTRVVDGEAVVAEAGGSTQVIPASNQKLFVAAVALGVLGADHRYRTELQGASPLGGVIAGDVYLIGGGDPVLRTAAVPDPLRFPAFNTTSLDALADQLVALGVTTIDGDVVGDGSRYDDEFRAPSWGDAITSVDAGPYDALLVNDGLVTADEYGLEPNRAAARVFLELLVQRGIAVTGGAQNFTRPADATVTTLAVVDSHPLVDVLVEMLHTSDNNTAEMVLKEIGYVATGQGTRQAGLDTIRATLEGWAVPTAGLELYDGSGLSRDDRTTCTTLTSLLSVSPVAATLRGLLPVAGRDGTLKEQLIGTAAEGAMQAKTGTLTGVKALSGVMPGADRAPVEFTVVLNAEGVELPETYLPVWNALVDVIARHPVVVVPDIARFAPR